MQIDVKEKKLQLSVLVFLFAQLYFILTRQEMES